MPSTTGTALTKLCCDILLADGPAACAAVEAGATTPALERVVEANNLLSGLGFESGGLALAHAVHNGITAIPTSHAFIHGEKVAFGLLTQLVLEGRPQADHCCHSAKVRGNRALPSMPIPPEAEALPPILIVVALPEELDHPAVLHTGLGKLNAAYALTRELQRRRPKLVVNYGTAGGLNPALAGLVEIRRVLQADMEAEPLAPRGQTPFSPGPIQLDSGSDGVVCGSGDRFVTAVDPWLLQHNVEVVDMELFAIASVCQWEGIPWRSFKYISDHADRDSGGSWQAHLQGGQALFLERLAALTGEV